VQAQQAVARRQRPNGKSAVVATVASATNAATHASRRRLYQFDLEAIPQIAGIALNTLGAIWMGRHRATSC
jgi:hypothetical protein